jgi:hypothetical protein
VSQVQIRKLDGLLKKQNPSSFPLYLFSINNHPGMGLKEGADNLVLGIYLHLLPLQYLLLSVLVSAFPLHFAFLSLTSTLD